jgi:hypothetical protein
MNKYSNMHTSVIDCRRKCEFYDIFDLLGEFYKRGYNISGQEIKS